MLRVCVYVLIIFFFSTISVYGNSQGELLKLFIESQKNDTSVSSNVKINYDIYIEKYNNNELSERQRFQFYKSMISLHEIRKWDNNLKSIVLIKFVQYDKNHEVPAYQKIDESRSAFMEFVNTFMKEEFGFLEEIKQQIKNDLRAKGLESERIDLDEDQIQEAINTVYHKISEGIDKDYLF